MDNIKYRIALGIIISLALAMRLYMVRADLPFTYWHDENNYIEMALKLGTGDLRLMSLSHGGLYQLALFCFYGAYYLAAKAFMLVRSPADIYISYLKDPTVFFLIARSLTALTGACAVFMSYLIASKSYDRCAGLLAALFAGFSLLMLQMSSFALADVPSVFLLLAGFYILMKSVEARSDNKLYSLASLLIGLAAACKYLAVFGIIPLFVASYIKSEGADNRTKRAAVYARNALLFVFIGFTIGMPFFILNIGKFFSDTVIRMGGEYIVRNPNKDTWLFYFTHHLRNGLGLPLESTALAGIAYAFYRRTKWDILIISFPVAYYLFIMNSMGFAYHMLPAVPFLLIAAGRLLSDIASRIAPSRRLLTSMLLGAVILAPSLSDSIKYAGICTGHDTRTIAKSWIEKNLPEDGSVLAEGYLFTLAVHTPPISGDKDTLERDLKYIEGKGGSGLSVKTLQKYSDKIFGKTKRFNIFKTDYMTRDDMAKINSDYMVLSGTNDYKAGKELLYYLPEDYFMKRSELRRDVKGRYDLIRSFSPTGELSGSFPHLMDHDYQVIRDLSFRDLPGYVKGPKIEIYKIKQESRP